jgi:rhodanese-related sulfurtransferase
MKRLVLLFLTVVLAMALLPVAMPVVAQGDAILSRLTEYNNNLPKGYGVISVDDLNVMLAEKKPVLLDVRQPEEYQAGHIKDSFNVPLRELAKNLALLPDKNADIVVICKGGFRAMMGMTALNILGYNNARNLKGGFDAWVGEELPSVTDAFKPEPGKAPDITADLLAAVDKVLSNLPKNWDGVAAKDLAAELVDAPPILIDVRSNEEWATGYIEGASHIWINEFMSRQKDWPADKNAKIVVYCAASYRGGIAKIMLNLMGYTNVRNLSGGSAAWVAAGLPLKGASAAAFNLDTALADFLKAMPETFNAVRPADLEAELKAGPKPVLLDVRTADEYTEGHLEGAINIPLQEITKHLDLLPKLDENIVVYCGSGHRSAIVMTALELLGYTKVRSMLSGITAWAAAKYPVSTTAVEAKAGARPEFKADIFKLVDAYMTAIPAGYYTIKAADLNVALTEKPPVLIDVRTDAEWSAGRIQGAVHIGLADFMTKKSEWPTDKAAAVVIYDNPTHRSTMAMVLMQLEGYTNVKVLSGGTGAWEKANLPLTK